MLLSVIFKNKLSAVYSGIARVPCAWRQNIFLHPHHQKLFSWKWKIDAKAQKKQKQNILLLLLLWDSKVTISVFESSCHLLLYNHSNYSKVEAIPLNALPKDTTSELAGLSLH